MADGAQADVTPVTTTPPTAVATVPGPEVGASYLQLTQTRVDLDQAGEAFTVPDETGRLPIVVLPKQPFRIRNELVIGGVIAIAIAVVLDFELPVRTGLLAVGAVMVFL